MRHNKGRPAKPHQPEELTAKFFELGEPIWGRAITQTLYDGLTIIEAIDKFGAFSDALSL